jgi:hypothetical protein
MNRKQKVLTVIALVAFVAIVIYDFSENYEGIEIITSSHSREVTQGSEPTEITDWGLTSLATLLLLLSVSYVGLLFVLADRKEQAITNRPAESIEDFKLRIAAMLRDKTEHISGARSPDVGAQEASDQNAEAASAMSVIKSAHEYEVRPRNDDRGVDLISDALPLGRLWYDTSDNAIASAMHRSPSHDAVIRVYDAAGNVIETHQHTVDFKER